MHESFKSRIASYPVTIQEFALMLRRLAQNEIPDAVEQIGGGSRLPIVLYSKAGPGKIICGIKPGEDMCRFYVHQFDKVRVENTWIEGSGKNARHMKVRELSQELEEKLRQVIVQVCKFI